MRFSRAKLVEVVNQLCYHNYDRTGKRYTLTSGQISDEYVDVKTALLSYDARELVAHCVKQTLEGATFHAVAGMELGGALLAMIMSDDLMAHALIIRKDDRSHGVTEKGVEGMGLLGKQQHRVLLVEDVITTGGSTLKALDRLAQFPNLEVTHALAVVDREQDGIAAVKAKYPHLNIQAMATLSEVRAWK